MSSEISLPQRMLVSGIAGMSGATCCHPLDVIRIQMQVNTGQPGYGGLPQAASTIVKKSGITSLYNGLSAAYLRQITYGSVRMGMYSYVFNKVKDDNNGVAPGLVKKMGIGFGSAAVGAFIGTPSEVALVRMGADSRLPPAEQRGYKNVLDCIRRIATEEGPTMLWRGAIPTVARAAFLGSCLMGVTGQAKEEFVNRGLLEANGLPLMFWAACVGSFFGNTLVMPLDVTKSRIQSMPTGPGVKPIYTGMIDCAKQSIKAEGVGVLWRGFTPAFIKLAPYTVISLTVLEQITLVMTGKSAM